MAGYNTWQVCLCEREGRGATGEKKSALHEIGARARDLAPFFLRSPHTRTSSLPFSQLLEAAAGVKGTPQEVKEQVSI